jgi:hypothetical protein
MLWSVKRDVSNSSIKVLQQHQSFARGLAIESKRFTKMVVAQRLDQDSDGGPNLDDGTYS